MRSVFQSCKAGFNIFVFLWKVAMVLGKKSSLIIVMIWPGTLICTFTGWYECGFTFEQLHSPTTILHYPFMKTFIFVCKCLARNA